MRIQVSTGLFREAAETVVARLVSAGFFSLQLSAAHRAADIPALARLKEEHGLEYTMHAPFPGSGAEHFDTRISNAKVEAQILASLENARQLDCPVVVMHAGYSHGDYDKEMAAIIASLHRCADAADKQGIGLCIENTDNAHTPAGVVRNVSVIEKLVKSGFRLCLDTSHLRTILASDSEVLDRKSVV